VAQKRRVSVKVNGEAIEVAPGAFLRLVHDETSDARVERFITLVYRFAHSRNTAAPTKAPADGHHPYAQ
jgi:hypothetical protein